MFNRLLLMGLVLAFSANALHAGLAPAKKDGDQTVEERSRGRVAPRTDSGAVVPTEKVSVGIYLAQVSAFSLLDNSFEADLYLWFRWQNPDLAPHTTFELLNGEIKNKEIQFVGKEGDSLLAVCRLQVVMTQFWDLQKFPYDSHQLKIELEDHQTIQYVPDLSNSGIDPATTIPGRDLLDPALTNSAHTYGSHFGESLLGGKGPKVYSRLSFTTEVKRAGRGYPFKLFIALYVAVGIALLGLWVRHDCVDGRLGLGGAALFAAVANEYVISSSLPNTSVFTTADKLHIVGVILIFVTLVVGNIASRIDEAGDNVRARRIDRRAFFSLVTAALVAWGLITW